MRIRCAAVVPLIFLGVACSGGSGGGPPSGNDGGTQPTSSAAGSCMGGLEAGCTVELCCQDYRGNFTSATAQSSCNAIDGNYSTAPCPTANLVGSCSLYQGTAAEQIVRYYSGYVFLDNPPGAGSVQANCAALHIGTYLPN
jgi:hypothetical protein